MDIRECYARIGGDYEDVLGRMMNKESLVQKFLFKIPEDKSYENLVSALEAGDGETAFRAAHTLKGVSQNLSLTRLADAVVPLTEALRGGTIPADAPQMLALVEASYKETVEAIRAFQSQTAAD